MDGVADELLVSAAKRLKGTVRRQFLGEVCRTLCDGSPRKAEERFGWGRETVGKGLRELDGSIPTASKTEPERRGRRRSGERNPQLVVDIRLGFHQHRFRRFEAVEGWAELALTAFLYLEWYRAGQLRRRGLGEKEKRW